MRYKIVNRSGKGYDTHIIDESGRPVEGVMACMVYPFDVNTGMLRAELTLGLGEVDIIVEGELVAACPACGWTHRNGVSINADAKNNQNKSIYRAPDGKSTLQPETDGRCVGRELYGRLTTDDDTTGSSDNGAKQSHFLRGYYGESGIFFPQNSYEPSADERRRLFGPDMPQDAFDPDQRPDMGYKLYREVYGEQSSAVALVHGVYYTEQDLRDMTEEDWEKLFAHKTRPK